MSLVLWHLLEIKGADIPGVQVGSAQWSPDSTRSLDTLAALPADKALPVRCWHVSWVCWPVDQTFRKTNWFKWCYWHDVMWYHVISYHHSCFHEVPPANTVQKRQTERKAIWPAWAVSGMSPGWKVLTSVLSKLPLPPLSFHLADIWAAVGPQADWGWLNCVPLGFQWCTQTVATSPVLKSVTFRTVLFSWGSGVSRFSFGFPESLTLGGEA